METVRVFVIYLNLNTVFVCNGYSAHTKGMITVTSWLGLVGREATILIPPRPVAHLISYVMEVGRAFSVGNSILPVLPFLLCVFLSNGRFDMPSPARDITVTSGNKQGTSLLHLEILVYKVRSTIQFLSILNMNYLPICTSRLVVQHPCLVSLKSMQRYRSWEDKLKYVKI